MASAYNNWDSTWPDRQSIKQKHDCIAQVCKWTYVLDCTGATYSWILFCLKLQKHALLSHLLQITGQQCKVDMLAFKSKENKVVCECLCIRKLTSLSKWDYSNSSVHFIRMHLKRGTNWVVTLYMYVQERERVCVSSSNIYSGNRISVLHII